jgi:hypothetical protein
MELRHLEWRLVDLIPESSSIVIHRVLEVLAAGLNELI